MKYALLILTVALFGCGTSMLAHVNGPGDAWTDGTYFAVSGSIAGTLTIYNGKGEVTKEYKWDAGAQRAWKRTSILLWKGSSWESCPYEEAYREAVAHGVTTLPAPAVAATP